MRKSHREAARILYEERNKDASSNQETYIDLHGLHPEESVEYLERVLLEQQCSTSGAVYAIVGTGHHSKNGKDKVGKAVRGWLGEWKYAFREFSVSGDNVGGILGIDPRSFDKNAREELGRGREGEEAGLQKEVSGGGVGGKVKVVKAIPTGPRGKEG